MIFNKIELKKFGIFAHKQKEKFEINVWSSWVTGHLVLDDVILNKVTVTPFSNYLNNLLNSGKKPIQVCRNYNEWTYCV